MTPAGLPGIVNDAVAVYFLDAAAAFVGAGAPGQLSRSALGHSECAKINRRDG